MSHIVTVSTEVRDRQAVDRACRRLGLSEPVEGEAKVFTTMKNGLLVRLKDWEFPIVCDLASGQVAFDNYGGHWGDRNRLDEFLQAYAVEKATVETRKRGHSVVEQPLPDGSIKLVIGIAGEGAMKTIELVVSPKGETKLETKGFSGDSCREASAFLEAALGAKQSDRPTAEAFTAVEETTLHHSS